MRYIKLALIVLVAGWLAFELAVNLESLKSSFAIALGLPWIPLGTLIMPAWLALCAAFILAFLIALILEISAWYEYTRLIRLQRKQIIALQEALDLKKNSADPGRPS
ncbi:MAG TPA: hypothetical protein VM658_02035 [bacterium]|nr:hypothetical protein [bacterium]